MCVQDVMVKQNLLVQFEYGQKKEISPSLIVLLITKEEVRMEQTLSHSPKKQQGALLTIVMNTEIGEP